MKNLWAIVLTTGLVLTGVVPAHAASKGKIEASVDTTLERFYREVSSGEDLVKNAKGVLVFPPVRAAGMGLGGEPVEGALQINGKTATYYNTSVSISTQDHGPMVTAAIVIIFQDSSALDKFRASAGWEAGVDASIAVVKVGAGGAMDTSKLNEPILGFIVGQFGHMYNFSTLEGAKFSKIER